MYGCGSIVIMSVAIFMRKTESDLFANATVVLTDFLIQYNGPYLSWPLEYMPPSLVWPKLLLLSLAYYMYSIPPLIRLYYLPRNCVFDVDVLRIATMGSEGNARLSMYSDTCKGPP